MRHDASGYFPVVQKRPTKEETKIMWITPYGMGRSYPFDACPRDPLDKHGNDPPRRTHPVQYRLNRFADAELVYCATCEEWFVPSKDYRG